MTFPRSVRSNVNRRRRFAKSSASRCDVPAIPCGWRSRRMRTCTTWCAISWVPCSTCSACPTLRPQWRGFWPAASGARRALPRRPPAFTCGGWSIRPSLAFQRPAKPFGKLNGMSWFERIVPSRIKTERRTRSVPEGLWTKCPACDAVLYRAEIERNLHVCPKCSHHMRISGRERLLKFLDPGTNREISVKVESEDPLKFKDTKRYKDRIVQAQKQTSERDALIVISGQLAGLEIVACAFEFRFLGGSMGSVVGEKFVRAVEVCLGHRLPLVCFSASGGARMQEGLYSLLQVAKTSAGLKRLSAARLPFIFVITDPTP